METFRKLAVRIEGNQTYGSGWIYQYEGDLGIIITAKHCVYDREREDTYENLRIFDFEEHTLEILFPPIYSEDGELDLAMVKVKISKKYPDILIDDPITGTNFTVFGYPQYLEESEDKGDPQRGSISEIINKDTLKLSVNNSLFTPDNSAYENVSGFSGSAVYHLSDGKYYVVGMVLSLRGEGRNGIIKAIHIYKIRELLQKNLNIDLVPRCLLNFDSYLEDIIQEVRNNGEQQEQKLIYLINKCYQNNFSDITPIMIQQSLEELLMVPTNKEFDYTEQSLWMGWLELLLFKFIQTDVYFDMHVCLKLVTQDKTIKGTHLIYTNQNTLESFIRCLFESNVYENIDDNDVLFVNNKEKRFRGDCIAKKDRIEGIVKNIGHSEIDERFSIDDPHKQKLFPIVHLQYVEDEIQRLLEGTKRLSGSEFVNEFPQKINELFRLIET